MCGLNGVAQFDGELQPRTSSHVKSMNKAIHHRGPDGKGFLVADVNGYSRLYHDEDIDSMKSMNVVFGHRRLAINDLSDRGLQPMSNENNQIHLIHNGEIYNYSSLRTTLEDLGHHFQSQCDSEVILHAYEEWGVDCAKKFNGMWSYIIFDQLKNRLICSRDRFGIKPLYYYFNGDRFIFSSEIKGLLAHPEVPSNVNRKKFFEYVSTGTSDFNEQTVYKQIYRVEPGHNVIVEGNNLHKESYWSMDSTVKKPSFGEAKQQYRELLIDSVQTRLRNSDVEVATCLSGGIDSSSIVGIASEYLNSPGSLKTFSYCAEDELNECKWVDKVVEYTGVKNYQNSIDTRTLKDHYDSFIQSFDLPVKMSSPFSQNIVMKDIQTKGVKVTLDGQGADELLGGYRGYLDYVVASRSSEHLESFKKYYDIDEKRSRYKIGYLQKFEALPGGHSYRNYINESYWRWYEDQWLSDEIAVPGQNGETVKKKRNEKFVQNRYNMCFRRSFQYDSLLKDVMYGDFTGRVLPMLLRWEDINSMSYSVEGRVPFLDHRLVDFLGQLPEEYLIGNGYTKRVARASMNGIVPDEILKRVDKKGYSTPASNWFHKVLSEYLLDALAGDSSEFKDMFNVQKIRQRLNQIRKDPDRYDPALDVIGGAVLCYRKILKGH